MKILHIFYGNDFAGGASYSMATLVAEIASRGHEVYALVPLTRRRLMTKHLSDKVAGCYNFPIPWVVYDHASQSIASKGKNILKAIAHLALYLPSEAYALFLAKRLNVDVIHIGGAVISTGRLASKLAGTKLIWHVREYVVEDHGLQYFPWTNPYRSFSDADSLICVSDTVAKKMHTTTECALIKRIYNGIDPPSDEPRKRQHSTPTFRLMFAGGLSRSKGLFDVLDAVAELEDSLPWSLEIFGRANHQQVSSFSRRCSELRIQDRVTYRGLIPDIVDQYRAHDALIVASRMEAFGRVTAEAMMNRCLVIGAASGATVELLGAKRGVLFEPGDARSLANAIRATVSTDSALRGIVIEQAYEFAVREFSIEAYTQGVLTTYAKA